MVVGAIGAALRYNFFIRILADHVTRILGAPLLSFLGDFGAPNPSWSTPLAPRTFSPFYSLSEMQLRATKSAYGDRLVFLGFPGCFPRAENDIQLHVPLPAEKGGGWPIG